MASKNIKIGGAIATATGIIALSNSIGWALLIIGGAVIFAILMKLKRNK